MHFADFKRENEELLTQLNVKIEIATTDIVDKLVKDSYLNHKFKILLKRGELLFSTPSTIVIPLSFKNLIKGFDVNDYELSWFREICIRHEIDEVRCIKSGSHKRYRTHADKKVLELENKHLAFAPEIIREIFGIIRGKE